MMQKILNMRSKNPETQKGFTLVEVLITAGILVIVIVGLIQLFIYCSTLSELTGNLTAAMIEAQAKMEEIRSHDYALIATDYASGGTPGNTFNLSAGNGIGVIYVDTSNSNLYQIEIVVCWNNNRNDRVIGEDKNLNGVLDAGEDTNGDGRIDSSVDIITNIAYR